MGDVAPLDEYMQVDMPPSPLVDRLDRVQPTLPGFLVGGTPAQLLPGCTQILDRSFQALTILLGQRHELEPMLPQLRDLRRVGVIEPIKVLHATLRTGPISTPRQGHVFMHGRTILTAEGPVGMPVDRLAWGSLAAFVRLMCSCFKTGIK